MNTGSQRHVTEMLKNTENNHRPSGDLILHNMQSRHAPEEPQQLGSEIFSEHNTLLPTQTYWPAIYLLAKRLYHI